MLRRVWWRLYYWWLSVRWCRHGIRQALPRGEDGASKFVCRCGATCSARLDLVLSDGERSVAMELVVEGCRAAREIARHVDAQPP